jgi:LAGLIDADG DNA endonuclease family protein
MLPRTLPSSAATEHSVSRSYVVLMSQTVVKLRRHTRRWTGEEVASLIRMRCENMKVPLIAAAIGRPSEAVYAMCKRLVRSGRIKSRKGRVWTTQDVASLGDASLRDEELAEVLQRTVLAVRQRRLALALLPKTRERWNIALDARLIALREQGLSFSNIACAMGRTESGICNRVSHLIRVCKITPLTRSDRSRRAAITSGVTREDRWSDNERDTVIALWKAGRTAREISVISGRSRSSIQNALGACRKTELVTRLSRPEIEKRLDRARLQRYEERCMAAEALVQALPDTKSAGYVIGVLFGDGFTSVTGHRGSIGLKSTNQSFCQAFAHALEETFHRKTRLLSRIEPVKRIGRYIYKNVRYYEAFLHSVHLALALRKSFGHTDERRWCANPNTMLQIGEQFADGVLQGFFDAEGSFMQSKAGRHYVSACSMNAEGLKSIQEVLRRRGYQVRVGADRRGQWRVTIHTKTQVLRFAKEISSRIDYKHARMEVCLRKHAAAAELSSAPPGGTSMLALSQA